MGGNEHLEGDLINIGGSVPQVFDEDFSRQTTAKREKGATDEAESVCSFLCERERAVLRVQSIRCSCLAVLVTIKLIILA